MQKTKKEKVFDYVFTKLAKHFSFIYKYMNETNFEDDSWELVMELTNAKNKYFEKKFCKETSDFTQTIFVLFNVCLDKIAKKKDEAEKLSKEVKTVLNTGYKIGNNYFQSLNEDYLLNSVARCKADSKHMLLSDEINTFFDGLTTYLLTDII